MQAYDEDAGFELWKTNGTKQGTKRVKDIRAGTNGSSPDFFMRLGKVVLFRAADGYDPGDHGDELWKTNGKAAGTKMVEDINPGNDGSDVSSIFRFGKIALLRASDGEHGAELWRTDGTANGTKMLKDIDPADGMSSYPSSFAKLGKFAYFSATTTDHGAELWRTDGTKNGTKLFKNINPGSEPSQPLSMTKLGDSLYFAAYGSAADGSELWTTDGTKQGTKLVKDILPGMNGSGPTNFGRVGGELLFRATGPEGSELYQTDGTKQGTKLLKDINSGGDSFPFDFARFGKNVFFQASDGSDPGDHSGELWRSDGTRQGTKLMKDIYPGTFGSYPCGMTPLGGKVLFGAFEPTAGPELWKTDGTVAGTKSLNIVPGDGGIGAFGCT
jgi:ELWxxDGT repeat protein